MYQTIYEAQVSFEIDWAFIAVCAIFLIFLVIVIDNWKDSGIGGHLFFGGVLAVLLIVIFSSVYSEFDARSKVYDAYKNGEYQVVEGVISGYTPAEEEQLHLPDNFEVGEVEFCTPGFVSRWGYPLKKTTGGVLENGIQVRIEYVFYKCENVIMKLEIIT